MEMVDLKTRPTEPLMNYEISELVGRHAVLFWLRDELNSELATPILGAGDYNAIYAFLKRRNEEITGYMDAAAEFHDSDKS